MDILSPSERSARMSGIRGKNTRPELTVRRELHRLGFRFRLHRNDLPGKPDIVLPKYRVVIFVHGCFWHRHAGCAKTQTPKANADFWQRKFARNVARDTDHAAEIRRLGWRVLVIWECQTKSKDRLVSLLQDVSTPLPNL